MANAQLVYAITDGFLSPTLPKRPVKPDYLYIRDTHRIRTANTASIKNPCGGGYTVYLGLVLTVTKYPLISQVPFVCMTDPGRTPTILKWTTTFDKKELIRDHTEQRQQYDECSNANASLCNQLLTSVEDMYLYPLKNAFTG